MYGGLVPAVEPGPWAGVCMFLSASAWGDPWERNKVPATSMDWGQSPCVPCAAPGESAGDHVSSSQDRARQADE